MMFQTNEIVQAGRTAVSGTRMKKSFRGFETVASSDILVSFRVCCLKRERFRRARQLDTVGGSTTGLHKESGWFLRTFAHFHCVPLPPKH